MDASSGKSTTYAFSVRQATDVGTRYETAFMQCWRHMRDSFYDQRLNNKNWDAIYRKYAPMARDAVDMEGLGQVVNMMLGELNGSHLGFYAGLSGRRSRGGASPGDERPGPTRPCIWACVSTRSSRGRA